MPKNRKLFKGILSYTNTKEVVIMSERTAQLVLNTPIKATQMAAISLGIVFAVVLSLYANVPLYELFLSFSILYHILIVVVFNI